MSIDGWNRVLVLGGIRSGKSEFAESLVAGAGAVRYVATSPGAAPGDAEWADRLQAHRARRPDSWSTEETAEDPRRLAEVIAAGQPHETLLVDDLGGWVTVLLDPVHQPADDTARIAELAAAVRDCPARLVLVSPEVGLSLVPTTPLGRAFADALGTANRAVADACDAVALVVAGQPCWLKPGPTSGSTAVGRPGTAVGRPGTAVGRPGTAVGRPGTAGQEAEPTQATALEADSPEAAPAVSWAPPDADGPVIGTGMQLPMPDEFAGPQAAERLATLDLPGTGLGVLERVVTFAAATQGTPTPRPWGQARVVVLHGDHAGGAAAGTTPGESARRAAQARAGVGALARLAVEAGAGLEVVTAPTSAPIEDGPALGTAEVESALHLGWHLAREAAEAGVHLVVLASCGTGTETAAAAVLAAMAGAEPPAVLPRVIVDGRVDDAAWMTRCAAVRDALHRSRRSPRGPKEVLAELGGGDVAVATGVLLGATARRVPVLLDGPVGVAAAMVARDLAGQARHWCLLPDHGRQPAVRLAADVLGLTPLLDLRLDLGEGANALAALPLLRSMLALVAALPPRPDGGQLTEPGGAGGDEQAPEFVEPEPAGPGPATSTPDTATRAG